MNIVIRIDTDWPAFKENGVGVEAARILRKVAAGIETHNTEAEIAKLDGTPLMDLDGNECGSFEASDGRS